MDFLQNSNISPFSLFYEKPLKTYLKSLLHTFKMSLNFQHYEFMNNLENWLQTDTNMLEIAELIPDLTHLTLFRVTFIKFMQQANSNGDNILTV